MRQKLLLTCFALLWLNGCSGTNVPDPIPNPTDPAVVEFIALVNAHRQSVGCTALSWHGLLAGVAQAHSDDMQKRDFFSHENPDGKDPFERLEDAGLSWVGRAGENISAVSEDATATLNSWLNSSGHRSNIELCDYTLHGVGRNANLWTHMFLVNMTAEP